MLVQGYSRYKKDVYIKNSLIINKPWYLQHFWNTSKPVVVSEKKKYNSITIRRQNKINSLNTYEPIPQSIKNKVNDEI